jgi:hypothetical protein
VVRLLSYLIFMFILGEYSFAQTSTLRNSTSEEKSISSARQRLDDALNLYLQGSYDKALSLVDNVLYDYSQNKEIIDSATSLKRLITTAQSQETDSNKQNATKQRATDVNQLDWQRDGADKKKGNRYLFGFSVDSTFTSYKKQNFNGLADYRGTIGVRTEGFLPYLDRSLGFGVNLASSVLDFNDARPASDYYLYRYSAYLMYRLAINLPVIAEPATMTLKLGVSGQYAQDLIKNGYATYESIKNYVMPQFEVSFQDAVLNRFFSNKFNANLIINPMIAIGYLPTKEADLISFDFGFGLYYRFDIFLIGPYYHFRFFRNGTSNENQLISEWSITLSIEI